jgi:hypothetical protein
VNGGLLTYVMRAQREDILIILRGEIVRYNERQELRVARHGSVVAFQLVRAQQGVAASNERLLTLMYLE